MPLCDQMNAVLKYSGFPRSHCFQIENTGSKLEEKHRNKTNNGIINSYLGYYHVYFLFLLTRLATERKQEEIC